MDPLQVTISRRLSCIVRAVLSTNIVTAIHWSVVHGNILLHFGHVKRVAALIHVENQVETSSSSLRRLTKSNVLGDSSDWVVLGMKCGISQHVQRTLECTSHQSSNLLSIDSIVCYSRQSSLHSHDITQKRQVVVIDVGTIKAQHFLQLSLDRSPRSLNTQRLVDLVDAIAVRSSRVDILVSESLEKRRANCL